MGDGRYYTFYQFNLSLIFIVLAILISSSTVISYYKNKDKETGIYASINFLLLLICIFSAFIENVINITYIGFWLRCISKASFIASMCVFSVFLFSYVIPIYRFRIREAFWVTTIICAATLVTKGKFLILNYGFWNVNYSVFYKLIIVGLFCFIVISLYKVLRCKTLLHSLYSNKTIATIFSILYFFPIGLYCVFTINEYKYLDFVECCLYFVMFVFINFATRAELSSGLTSKQFEELSDMLEDYVVVIDNYGNIVYKNEIFKKSTNFVDTNTVDIKNIDLIFNKSIKIINNSSGNKYIQIEQESKTEYFTYKYKKLIDGDKTLGYMATITNITHLIDLVNSLEANNKKYVETNNRLSHYSNVVYHLEKEKEINILLEEIITSREKSMDNLIVRIEDLEMSLDSDDFKIKLNNAIHLNIDILNGVRHAVTAYREHYGGNK